MLHFQRFREIAHAVEHIGKISQAASQSGLIVNLAIGSNGLLVILPRLSQISVVVINVADIVERSRDASLIAQGAKHGKRILICLAGFREVSLVIEQMPG